jgi:hypothetical protein
MSEAASGIALGIEIDEQDLLLGERQCAARLTAVVVFPTPPF